jgi:predicted nucleic acid-binding protein
MKRAAAFNYESGRDGESGSSNIYPAIEIIARRAGELRSELSRHGITHLPIAT